MLVSIHIHSAFSKLFPNLTLKADIKNYADITYYLGSMHPRFLRYAKAIEQGECQEGYALMDKNFKLISDQDLFIKTAKKDDVFYLVPAIVGGGGGRGTKRLLQFAAIATAAYFAAPYAAQFFSSSGAVAADPLLTTGTAQMSTSTLGSSLGISAGTLAVNAGLAVVTALFTQRPDIRSSDQNIRTNDMFGSLQNTVDSGTPIPLIYGLHRVPGQLISGYLDTVDHGRSDNITVASRFTS